MTNWLQSTFLSAKGLANGDTELCGRSTIGWNGAVDDYYDGLQYNDEGYWTLPLIPDFYDELKSIVITKVVIRWWPYDVDSTQTYTPSTPSSSITVKVTGANPYIGDPYNHYYYNEFYNNTAEMKVSTETDFPLNQNIFKFWLKACSSWYKSSGYIPQTSSEYGNGPFYFHRSSYIEWKAVGKSALHSMIDTSVGQKLDEGLPNIKGRTSYLGYRHAPHEGYIPKGAFYLAERNGVKYYGNYGLGWGAGDQGLDDELAFDASGYNPIYGATATVQPKSLVTRFMIKY